MLGRHHQKGGKIVMHEMLTKNCDPIVMGLEANKSNMYDCKVI